MSHRRALALIAGLCLLAVPSLEASVRAAPEGSVAITAEFVVYERPFANDKNLGAFDHHELFHPGGVGPSGLVCSPDRVDIIANEISLTVDPTGGPLTGAGLLELSCEYHPGCGAVSRTQSFSFRGEYDSVNRHVLGVVDFESSGGETTSWGDGPDGPEMCLESTWVQDPRAYTTDWMLDFDANLGFLLPSPCSSDPHQGIGWFTATEGAGLVGAPIGQVRADDMVDPSCAPTGADGASEGDSEAMVSGTASSEATENTSPSTNGDEAGESSVAQEASGDEVSAESSNGGGTDLNPVLVGVAGLMLILILYGAWLALRGHLDLSTAEIVGGVAAVGMTDPDSLVDMVESMGERDPEQQESTVEPVRPPQFTDDSEPVGTIEVSSEVQAISPTGATLTLPPGTSYPAGTTTTSDGQKWRSILVGDDHWWIRSDERGAEMNEDWSAPSEGTPEVLTPLPRTTLTLTEVRSIMVPSAGNTWTQKHFEPGEYVLGPVQPTPSGDRYDVLRQVAPDKWERVINLPESVIEQQLFKEQ